MAREPRHVKLVDHCLGKGPVERQIALPIIAIGIGYDAFHGGGGIVNRPRSCPAVVFVWDNYGEPVGVEEHLLGVEPISALRDKRTVCPVGIHLARLQARYKDMPVLMGAVFIRIESDDPCRPAGILVVEQQQLHVLPAFREHAEVHAAEANRRAKRSTRTRF
jgi:hypothetical protein